MNLTAAYPVHEDSQIGPARRAAAQLASQLGFPETREAQAALIASELATNLARHARSGELLFRPLYEGRHGGPAAGLEMLAIDHGPGMPDVALSRTDGFSTAGTLGHGLGAIERQADFFRVHTAPTGTIAVARLFRSAPVRTFRTLPVDVGAVNVSKAGEDVCGDSWTWHGREDRVSVLVADGLGHGLYAHEASRLAAEVFDRVHEEAPARAIGDVHLALRATRGAAVAAIALDLARGVARYAGLGNVTTVICRPNGTRQTCVSHNGTAGQGNPRIHEFQYPIEPDSVVVMFSDGLSTRWDVRQDTGLLALHPSLIAGALYRDFSRGRDDVTVVVLKRREPASTSL